MSSRRDDYEGEELATLYVRQVHYGARSADLRALFERIGPVRDVYIPLDYYTRQSRGFAYVKFEFVRDAENALKRYNGINVMGRPIEIEWAEGHRKTRSEMRAKDRYSSSHLDRSRYRSRSPYISRDRSPRNRSRSRCRSHSRSRSKLRSRVSRRHCSSSKLHHDRRRSRSSESHSDREIRKRDRKKAKLSPASDSSRRSLGNRKKRDNDEINAILDESNTSKSKITEILDETVSIDELEVRSEERASDVEICEKPGEKSFTENGGFEFLDDNVDMADEKNGGSFTVEGKDKDIMDIEIIDEIVENNYVLKSGSCGE